MISFIRTTLVLSAALYRHRTADAKFSSVLIFDPGRLSLNNKNNKCTREERWCYSWRSCHLYSDRADFMKAEHGCLKPKNVWQMRCCQDNSKKIPEQAEGAGWHRCTSVPYHCMPCHLRQTKTRMLSKTSIFFFLLNVFISYLYRKTKYSQRLGFFFFLSSWVIKLCV